MKKLLLGIVLAMLAVMPSMADDLVYHGSFLWNNIRAVAHSGNYLYCAFHDGVGVVNLSQDFNKKKLYSTLELDGRPRRLHLFGNILTVENEIGVIDLVDISDPSDISHLGSFTPGLEVFDLELLDNFLYAAVEYDGVMRYDISDPSDIRFDDSSMAGIRVIQLDVYDSRLFVLDDYNGILIYEPDSMSFGAVVSELLLPDQAVSFDVFNDTVYAGTRPNGYMVGAVTDIYNPQYIGFRSSYLRGDFITGTSQGLVFANSISGFELLYDSDTLPGQMFPMSDIYGYPEVFNYDGRNYIAYPHMERGFIIFAVDYPEYIDIDYPDVVYAYPGPITQVEFMHSRLHAVGVYNWYEIYDLTNPDQPFRSGKMINPPYRPVGMCSKGDTIFVADLATNSFFPAVDYGFGDPLSIFPFFSVVDSVERPTIIPDYFGDMDLLYFTNEHRLNGTARNSEIAVPNLFRWSFPTGVAAAAFNGPIVYTVSDKGVLFVHQVEDDNQLTELTYTNLTGRVNDMFLRDTLLYMAADGIRIFSINDPMNPELVYTEDIGTVYEFDRSGDQLACAARSGVYLYDIGGGIPEPLFSGGDMAMLVSFDYQTIVASDSFSVKVYTLPLSDVDDNLPLTFDIEAPKIYGYPNPFNPEIKLVLENFGIQPRHLTVDVYDILGRQIRSLPVAVGNGIRPEVYWDGCDEEGQSMPSGMYFFRAGDISDQAVFKAVLLK